MTNPKNLSNSFKQNDFWWFLLQKQSSFKKSIMPTSCASFLISDAPIWLIFLDILSLIVEKQPSEKKITQCCFKKKLMTLSCLFTLDYKSWVCTVLSFWLVFHLLQLLQVSIVHFLQWKLCHRKHQTVLEWNFAEVFLEAWPFWKLFAFLFWHFKLIGIFQAFIIKCSKTTSCSVFRVWFMLFLLLPGSGVLILTTKFFVVKNLVSIFILWSIYLIKSWITRFCFVFAGLIRMKFG